MAPNNLALVTSVARAVAITGATFTFASRIPRTLKWFFVFLIALNIRGFPLWWHIKILWPWYKPIIRSRIAGRRGGTPARMKLLTEISKVGKSPFGPSTIVRTRAGIADCDYNGHLSNSSFAKNVDQGRMEACVEAFPAFSAIGGKLALGGAYYHFVKEIPLLAEYEIHVSIGGWEADKWLYLVAQFLTYPKRSKSDKVKAQASQAVKTAQQEAKDVLKDVLPPTSSQAPLTTESESGSVTGVESISDSSFGESGILVVPPSITAPTSGTSTPGITSAAVSAAMSNTARPLPEGAVLHCTVVSVYTFKMGRITVPPRVAMITAGFGDASRWDQVQAWRKDGTLKKKLQGGWKEDTTGFWDFAEWEAEGRKRGDRLRDARMTLDAMGGRV